MKKNIWVIIQNACFLGSLFSLKILQTPNNFFNRYQTKEIHVRELKKLLLKLVSLEYIGTNFKPLKMLKEGGNKPSNF
jgi:hypothetical protein